MTIVERITAVLRTADQRKSKTLYDSIEKWLRESREKSENADLAVARVRGLMYAHFGHLEIVEAFTIAESSDFGEWSVTVRHWDGLVVEITHAS